MKQLCFFIGALALLLIACQSGKPPVITGELKKWHTITLTFTGPHSSEDAEVNPNLDYHFEVTFRKGEHAFTIPGYFSADGDAANSSANEGNKWRVHFCPDEEGQWSYYATFRKGKDAALSYEPESLPSGKYFDAVQGKFDVGPTDKAGRDFRGKGRLEYYNQRYWRFAESGEYFLRAGVSADNFFACADFDGDFKSDGHNDELVKRWEAHLRDWQPGDPEWQGGKSKGAIGTINYLAGQGINSLSLLTMNIAGGDQNVFPYTRYDERLRFDVARLDQWEIVMEHANKMGILLQLRTQEGENQSLLDNGGLDRERRLYYRMLIARFAHHPALVWDLGETGGIANLSSVQSARPQSAEQRLDMAQDFYENDPYLHPLLFQISGEFNELLTSGSKFTAAALRAPSQNAHAQVLLYRQQADKRGLVWVVGHMAASDWPAREMSGAMNPPQTDVLRKGALWGSLTAGGAGVDYRKVIQNGAPDLNLQEFRSNEQLWSQNRYALAFFRSLPFADMECRDDLVSNKSCFCFCKPGQAYVLYLPDGGTTQLDLQGASSALELRWFNPRTGEFSGAAKAIKGGGRVLLGPPPADPKSDWAAVLR